MWKIDKKLEIPLYLQVYETIRETIEDGELSEGEVLMSERDISDFLSVSRMTVNKAITKLVDEGHVIRQRTGTTVAKKRPITRYGNLDGLTQMKKKQGKTLSNMLVSFEEIKLSKWLKRELATISDDGYKIKRVRYVDNVPLVLETAYLNKEMFPDLTVSLVELSSMYELYGKKYDHHVSRAEQIIRPVYLKEEQAKLLAQKNGDLALLIKRHSFTKEEQVLEYTESVFLSQKHDLQIALS